MDLERCLWELGSVAHQHSSILASVVSADVRPERLSAFANDWSKIIGDGTYDLSAANQRVGDDVLLECPVWQLHEGLLLESVAPRIPKSNVFRSCLDCDFLGFICLTIAFKFDVELLLLRDWDATLVEFVADVTSNFCAVGFYHVSVLQ